MKTAHTNTILFEKWKFGQNCHWLSLLVIQCHRLSLVVTRCTACCYSLSLVVTCCTTRCHSLSFVVTRCTCCHSLYHSLSLVAIRCHSLYYLLSFVVTRCTTSCPSLSLTVTRYTTRLSFDKRLLWRPDIFSSQHVLQRYILWCMKSWTPLFKKLSSISSFSKWLC